MAMLVITRGYIIQLLREKVDSCWFNQFNPESCLVLLWAAKFPCLSWSVKQPLPSTASSPSFLCHKPYSCIWDITSVWLMVWLPLKSTSQFSIIANRMDNGKSRLKPPTCTARKISWHIILPVNDPTISLRPEHCLFVDAFPWVCPLF